MINIQHKINRVYALIVILSLLTILKINSTKNLRDPSGINPQDDTQKHVNLIWNYTLNYDRLILN